MITVLRLGHRISRDKRITTHVALVARAFGARKMLVNAKDEDLERRIGKVTERFGGDFTVESDCDWRKVMRAWSGTTVHLTMYGELLDDALARIPRGDDLLVIVGAEKVPSEVFKEADFNIAVGNQPHSEISALAIFLDRYLEGEELNTNFKGKVRIVPSAEGKKLVRKVSTVEQCIEVLQDAGCDDATIEHCRTVNKLAVKIAKMCEADVHLVAIASMLHDVGRSKAHDIRHGIEGARIIRGLGFPEEVARIIEKHIGAGLENDEVKRLGLPPGDYIPHTLEEKIVCHADSLISQNRKISLEDLIERYGSEGLDKYIKNLKRLHEELSKVCGMNLDDISLD